MQDFNQFICDLQSLININSEKTTASTLAPFGEGVKNALLTFLNIAKRMGFETINYDNYIGEVCFGEGEEIGIIGHMDVVPAGIGWNTPPYQLTKVGDTYYGRGLADDKAPMLACLYALKELKDSGAIPNKKFRIFVGCDEESGWQDVDYFSKNYKFPEYGFSPDGNFPVSYAEKGVTVLKFTLPKFKNFFDVKGGTVVNAVCAEASAVCNLEPNPKLLSKHGLTLKDGRVVSYGKSAHGSTPQLGINAMKALFEFFLDMGEDVQAVIDYLFNDKAGIFDMVNGQGNVTLSPGLISETDDGIVITCDMRIPAPFTFNDVLPKIKEFGLKFTSSDKHPPVMVEKEGWFVSAMISAYNAVTGKNAKPVAMGGSTFARVFEKGCAFGADYPDEQCGIHEPNEHITEKALKEILEIYTLALKNINAR